MKNSDQSEESEASATVMTHVPGNSFTIMGLDRPKYVEDLIGSLNSLRDSSHIKLGFGRVNRIFPNAAVPIAAALDYFAQAGMDIEVGETPTDVARTFLTAPRTLDDFTRYETPLTHVVWKYRNETEAGALANYFVDALMHGVRCQEGVVDTLNWCLYEIMDNVFQHSNANHGFVMMQLHKTRPRCAITVSDSGIGIQRSLFDSFTKSGTPYHPIASAHQAITYALGQGVTSKIGKNQGNGLFGLRSAIEINGGQLEIRSGRGDWLLKDGATTADTQLYRPVMEANLHQGTTVDWQLDCSQPVSISDALGIQTRGSEIAESIEDEFGEHRLIVLDLEDQLGSRAKGEEIRNLLMNYVNAGARNLVLDFKGVNIVSSSFADEVLGKLAREMGELEFRRRMRLENVKPTILAIVERAILLRTGSGSS